MSKLLTLILLACLPAVVRAADDTVTLGSTVIKMPNPAGMVGLPKDGPEAKAQADLVPPGCLLLRDFISAEALNPTAPTAPDANVLRCFVYVYKDVLQDVDSGNFVDFVESTAHLANHGILLSKDSAFDYVESQARLDKFQKDTGVSMSEASDLYSLGIVSRSDACVALMVVQYVNTTIDGKTQRDKCLSVVAFVLLNKKLVVIETWLKKPNIFGDDMRTLKHAAEKYQLALQILNNS